MSLIRKHVAVLQAWGCLALVHYWQRSLSHSTGHALLKLTTSTHADWLKLCIRLIRACLDQYELN